MFNNRLERHDDAPVIQLGGAQLAGYPATAPPVSRSIPEALNALSGAQTFLEERLADLYQRLDAAGVLREGPSTRGQEVSKDAPPPCALAGGIEGMRRRTMQQAEAVALLVSRLEV